MFALWILKGQENLTERTDGEWRSYNLELCTPEQQLCILHLTYSNLTKTAVNQTLFSSALLKLTNRKPS